MPAEYGFTLPCTVSYESDEINGRAPFSLRDADGKSLVSAVVYVNLLSADEPGLIIDDGFARWLSVQREQL